MTGYRLAVDTDYRAIDAFLLDHWRSSMFLRSARADTGRGNAGTRFWVSDGADGITGAVALTSRGELLLQCPDLAGIPDLARVLAGEGVGACNGACAQVHAALSALGLAAHPMQLLRDEPLLTLTLSDLLPRSRDLALRRAAEPDRDLLTAWRVDYNRETLGVSGPGDVATAAGDVQRYMTLGRLRILENQGLPVAMTAFNAIAAEAVQIGGVYTPPQHRGKGYAREAVARHLLEARDGGASRAVLFAAGLAARKAYEAIGFAHSGCYTLAILAEAQEVQL